MASDALTPSTGGHPAPQRIQLRRVKGWRLQDVSRALNGLPAIKCARPGVLSNPFIGPECVDVYRKYLAEPGGFELKLGDGVGLAYIPGWRHRHDVLDAIAMLRTNPHNVACFCALTKSCHCDVLLDLIRQPEPAHAPK